MVVAVKQIVRVRGGGLVQIRSKELKAGDDAEVIVLVTERANCRNGKHPKSSRRGAESLSKVPIARMTKQVREDIEWAKRCVLNRGQNLVGTDQGRAGSSVDYVVEFSSQCGEKRSTSSPILSSSESKRPSIHYPGNPPPAWLHKTRRL